jgi:hypothetical protein
MYSSNFIDAYPLLSLEINLFVSLNDTPWVENHDITLYCDLKNYPNGIPFSASNFIIVTSLSVFPSGYSFLSASGFFK